MKLDENTIVQYSNSNVLRNTVVNNSDMIKDRNHEGRKIEKVDTSQITYTNENGHEEQIAYDRMASGIQDREDEYIQWLSFIMDVVEP